MTKIYLKEISTCFECPNCIEEELSDFCQILFQNVDYLGKFLSKCPLKNKNELISSK